MLVMAVMCSAFVGAQSREALRINEVMIENDSTSIVDDYGQYSAWIEIFNTNYAPIDIASVYLTNDSTNTKLYPVPKGDTRTKMHARQHILFYADGEPNKGSLHTSLTFKAGVENWVGLYDLNGKLIDSVTIPATVLPGQSWARVEDGSDVWELRDGGDKYITPGSANLINDKNEKIERFATKDARGFGMTVTAMGIVFTALLCLCLCFIAFGKVGSMFSRYHKARATGAVVEDIDLSEIRAVKQDTGEEIAAIVMALHEHLYAHDDELTILTIDKVQRRYSPWNSKIYNIREVPKVRK